MTNLIDRLHALYPSFRDLPAALLPRLLEQKLVALPAGSVLFDEGVACSGFPLLLAGEIRVQKFSAGGRALHLYNVLPGRSCVITQGCLLGAHDYNARGSAHTDVELLALSKALFETLLAQHLPFRTFVFGLFAERIADLMAVVDEVAFKHLDQRLARLLIERGPQLCTTHQALADDLGSVREIVSRLLRQFADEGLVSLARESILVLDRARLEQRQRA